MLDSFIHRHWINYFLLDNSIGFGGTQTVIYALDSTIKFLNKYGEDVFRRLFRQAFLALICGVLNVICL